MLQRMTDENYFRPPTRIRPYAAADRSAVRFICAETADSGRPAEMFFSDRETIADMVTRYYTDHEPESLWVVDCEGEAVGYLSGTVDTRRMQRIARLHVYPRAAVAAFLRGDFLRSEGWRLLLCALRTAPGLRSAMLGVERAGFPAHMHINLLPAFRGRGHGALLLQAFITELAKRGVGGLHAAVREDNRSACAFFERKGFRVAGNYVMYLPTRKGAQVARVSVYGRHS
jgi:ribosomal protein S18 acetylase RimI-like enzyme